MSMNNPRGIERIATLAVALGAHIESPGDDLVEIHHGGQRYGPYDRLSDVWDALNLIDDASQ